MVATLRAPKRLLGFLFFVTVLAVAVAAALDLAFTVRFLGQRVFIYGEAEVLHEAARLREGLTIYTDPIAGAFDQGPFPSRVYVVYPRLWSFIPARAVEVVAQGFAAVSWFGTLAAVVATAEPALRRQGGLAAGWLSGIWVVTVFATCGRPDAFAVALAGWAFVRSVRGGRLDTGSAVLFALTAWLKPNVFALAIGAGPRR